MRFRPRLFPVSPLSVLLLSLPGGCTVANPTYCNPNFPCAAGHYCDLSIQTCIADSDPPTVVGSVPADGASEVALDAVVLLTFAEPIDPESVDGQSVRLLLAGRTVSARVNLEGREVTVVPSAALQAGGRYRVEVSVGVRDLAGNPLDSAAVISFTTSPGPTVFDASPAPGAEDVVASAEIVVELSEPIDPSSVTDETLLVRHSGGPVAGEMIVERAALRFVPAFPLAAATRYEVRLSTDLRDLDGHRPARATTWSFSTAPQPQLLSHEPEQGATGVAHGAVIRLRFDRALLKTSVGAENLRVIANGEPVAGSVSLSGSADLLTFRPATPFGHNVEVVVALGGDIRSASGMPLAESAEWGFVTFDGEPPTVMATSPADRSTDGNLEQIVVTFSEPIAPASAVTRATLFDLESTGGGRGIAATQERVEGDLLIIEPVRPLALGASYELSVDHVADVNGNRMLQPHQFAFTTRQGRWRRDEVLPGSAGATLSAPLLGMDAEGGGLVVWSEHETNGRSKVMGRRVSLREPWESSDSWRLDRHATGEVRPACLRQSPNGRALLVWMHAPAQLDGLSAVGVYGRALLPGQGWADEIQEMDDADTLVWGGIACWMTDDSGGVVFGLTEDTAATPPQRRSFAAKQHLDRRGWWTPRDQVEPEPGPDDFVRTLGFLAASARHGPLGTLPLMLWIHESRDASGRRTYSLRRSYDMYPQTPTYVELGSAVSENLHHATINGAGDILLLSAGSPEELSLTVELRARYFNSSNPRDLPLELPGRHIFRPYRDGAVLTSKGLLRPSGEALAAWVARPALDSELPQSQLALYLGLRSHGRWQPARQLDTGRLGHDFALLQDRAGNVLLVWSKYSGEQGRGLELWGTRFRVGEQGTSRPELLTRDESGCLLGGGLQGAMSERGNAMVAYQFSPWDAGSGTCDRTRAEVAVHRYE